jgi:hypothetical protein
MGMLRMSMIVPEIGRISKAAAAPPRDPALSA